MAAKVIRCLPVTDKSLNLLMIFAQTHEHQCIYIYIYTNTHAHSVYPPLAHHSQSCQSAHAVASKMLMIIPFDLRVWKNSAITLYYDQGYPGTCLLV